MKRGKDKPVEDIEESEEYHPERKNKIIIIAVILIIVAVLFGAKIYLLFHYLLGNDILINTIPNTENIFLSHGESKIVAFEISVLANPFCKVECNYSFEDISENEIYDEGMLNAKLTSSTKKEYNLTAPTNGVGQKLYRFDTLCTSIKTTLCSTDGKWIKKSLLITLDYNYTLEEQEAREKAVVNYPNYLDSLNNLTKESYILSKVIQKVDNFSLNEYEKSLGVIKSENENISEQIKTIALLWDAEKLSGMGIILSEVNTTIIKTNSDFQKLNKSVFAEVKDYNSILLNISTIEKEIKIYSTLNSTQPTASNLDEIINEFNSLKNSILVKQNISNKKMQFDEFYKNYSLIKTQLEEEIKSDTSKNFQSSNVISNISLEIIVIPEIETNLIFVNYKLKDSATSCCFKGKCSSCCNNSCYGNSTLYPVIFIHGHDFSASVSPEYNLESFGDLQNKLEEEGYLNSGSILINVPESTVNGIWGETPNPISVKASYYFDTIKNQSTFNVLQAKKDNIDTYSIRLKNIIDTVKYKTNREKVIVISHSMGGLVIRRYVQLFGDSGIDKIIMITSPNKGITPDALKICRLFGAQKECDDMDTNSALINKLNWQTGFNIPVYNIIGIGCDTYGEDGDGVVTNSSAYLDWANNYYVSGTCKSSQFKYLHTEIIYPKAYPANYEIIKGILKGNISE
ncbi:MAG: alpha/beta hydrolase [Candidatus Pacearchaeota archaeon]